MGVKGDDLTGRTPLLWREDVSDRYLPDFPQGEEYDHLDKGGQLLFNLGPMREIWGHRPGQIFLIVLLVSMVALLLVIRYFFEPILIFGWMPLPFFSGLLFVLIWLVAYLIYFFKFWPYRD